VIGNQSVAFPGGGILMVGGSLAPIDSTITGNTPDDCNGC